jgi:murein DD-endopeptidase MepM/ murein hydrolase activator NlpD
MAFFEEPKMKTQKLNVKPFAILIASFVFVGTANGHELPYPINSSYGVSQGNNTGTHTGVEAWAYDFSIGLNQPIVATEAGTVFKIKQDSTRYGCSSAYGNDGNYVVIDHGNGQRSLYLHLQKNSVPVRVGDTVAKGQRLGTVGNSGWICGNPGTHLHYQLQSTCNSWYCQSTPVLFAPRLLSPAQGTRPASRTVNFHWESIPYSSLYRIVVSQYSDFRGYNDSTRICDGTCFTTTLTGTSYSKYMSNGNYKYYVRIRANDSTSSRGASNWSNSWFTTPN